MRKWRNWQTRTFEGRVEHSIRVQVPSSAFFFFYFPEKGLERAGNEGAVAFTPKTEKCDSPLVSSDTPAVLFLLYRGEKVPKRGTLWKSWVFRTLRSAGQGVAPTPYRLLEKAGENFQTNLRQSRTGPDRARRREFKSRLPHFSFLFEAVAKLRNGERQQPFLLYLISTARRHKT